MTLEEVVRKLEADRTNLQTRLALYTALPPANWPNIIMATMEGMLLKVQEMLYLLHLVNTSGKEPDGRV